MPRYLIVQSSDCRPFQVLAPSADLALRLFARDVLKMADAEDASFDRGNVDVGVYDLPAVQAAGVFPLTESRL